MFTTEQIARSHMIDDFEKVRTRALRTVTRQERLLTDALDAIAAGHLDAATDLVERARDALLKERNTLRQDVPATAR